MVARTGCSSRNIRDDRALVLVVVDLLRMHKQVLKHCTLRHQMTKPPLLCMRQTADFFQSCQS